MRYLRCLLLLLIIFPLFVSATIIKLQIDGPIDTITEEYIGDHFENIIKLENIKLVIIELDTPGGFDTSMRAIIKNILNSSAPVAVYVSPRGARAASAGFFITISADIASMAPGTNMGAASPVAISGQKIEETMKKKITNDAVSYARSLAKSRNRNQELSEKAVRESKSYTAGECLKSRLIEYIAEDIEHLIRQLEGQEITMTNGEKKTLNLRGEAIETLSQKNSQPGWRKCDWQR